VYRLLVIEFEGVLMPAGQALGNPVDLIWRPILEALLRPWPDVRIVVTTGRQPPSAASELSQLLGPLRDRLCGNTFGMNRQDAIPAAVALINGAQFVHLVLVSDATGLPKHRLNVVECNPELGLFAEETRLSVARWLHDTAPPADPFRQLSL
jgi:hypothetical protein